MAIVWKDERGVQYVGRVLRKHYEANVRIMSDVWAGQHSLVHAGSIPRDCASHA